MIFQQNYISITVWNEFAHSSDAFASIVIFALTANFRRNIYIGRFHLKVDAAHLRATHEPVNTIIWGVIKIVDLLCAEHFFSPIRSLSNNNNSPKIHFRIAVNRIRTNNKTTRIILGRASLSTLLFFLEQERARYDISAKQNDTARWCV